MLQYNIKFSKTFNKHILAIHNFISQDDSSYADIVINSIMSHCTGLLSIMPYMGPAINEEQRTRQTIEKSFNYKITYIIDEEKKTITLVSVYKQHI